MATERRVDPDDGVAYTWEEFEAFYKGKYKKPAIAAYWEECKPVKSRRARKAKAEAEEWYEEAPAKKAPKAKGKGKAKKEEVYEEEAPKKTKKAKKKTEEEPKAKGSGKGTKSTAEAKPKAKAKAKAVVKKAAKPAGAFKVCVCGGAGGIGQPLSLLMGLDPNVKELCIFDLSVAMVPPEGVATDLGHLERKSAVKGYVMTVGEKPIDHLKECLTGCNLVLIPAGVPRKPGMTRDDLFKVNADIAKGIVEACAKYCPEAILGMIVNPVNSVVPAMAELYKKKGLDPLKICGVTTLDVVRANKFVGEITGKNPRFVNVPVIGGHAGTTILPLFSQDKVAKTIDAEKIPDLDKHVQDAGTDVVNAKGGKGSATLSMAYAGARFGSSVLAGLAGRKRTECCYVSSSVTDLPYFSSKVTFGETGVIKVIPLPTDLTEYETKRLEELKAVLKGEIETGLKYAEANSLAD